MHETIDIEVLEKSTSTEYVFVMSNDGQLRDIIRKHTSEKTYAPVAAHDVPDRVFEAFRTFRRQLYSQ